MRIAVLGPSWNPLTEPYAGGQEALVATLVHGLREHGHDVLLYAHADTDPRLADEFVPYAYLPELSCVAALDPQLPEPFFLSDQHAFAGAMADLLARDDLDVVLNHGLHQLPLVLSRLLTVPLVTTLHTPPFPWLELGAAVAGPNARYVAVSAALASQWSTLHPAPVVIPNGIRMERFALGAGGAGLVWAGRITAEKGTHVAIEAARLAGRHLDIVGPIADAAYFEREVRPHLGADVSYLGHLGHDELAIVFGGSAAALVTPLWDEPFGLVAAEAAACGTPLVALRRGGLADVVAPGMGVFAALPPADSDLRGTGTDAVDAAATPLTGLAHDTVEAQAAALPHAPEPTHDQGTEHAHGTPTGTAAPLPYAPELTDSRRTEHAHGTPDEVDAHVAARALAAAVPLAVALDRAQVRRAAARRHSSTRMVLAYERLAMELVASAAAPASAMALAR